jgi:hypothetical protein
MQARVGVALADHHIVAVERDAASLRDLLSLSAVGETRYPDQIKCSKVANFSFNNGGLYIILVKL